jgi:hypothetical protein
MKNILKTLFDLFEEAVFIPILIMIFIVSALAFSNQTNVDQYSGRISQIYCQNDQLNGKQIYVSGEAQNYQSDVSKIRLRFLQNGESVNNFYLANPATFQNKALTTYLENSQITLQAYDEVTKTFIDLDSKIANCQSTGSAGFSQGRSSITISKDEIKADGHDFAVLEIKLLDKSGQPLVGQEVTINITDQYDDLSTGNKEISGNLTSQKGAIKLQVVYDLHDKKTNQAEIGFTVGEIEYKGSVTIKYLHSTDNVIGSINEVICVSDQNFRPIMDIGGTAHDPDNLNEPVQATFYLTRNSDHKQLNLGYSFTDQDQKFALSINREIFDFGDSIDVYLTDLNSGAENYLGQILPDCSIK